jgi:hypothetical protein
MAGGGGLSWHFQNSIKIHFGGQNGIKKRPERLVVHKNVSH